MALRLIIGRAGSGKSRLCREEILARLKDDPAGFPLVYLVPEQATFQAEYELAASPGLGGVIRAQVLSFRRLAWKVMQELGGGRRLFIDDTGKGMVLRKVLEKHRAELKVFRHVRAKTGVIDSLVQFFSELKRSSIPIIRWREVFQERLETGEELPALFKEKMGDLILIMEEADRELAGHYLDAEDYLAVLAAQVPRSSFLKEAEVWVDGFYGFSNLEYLVLEKLLQCCRQVTLTVCLDRAYSSQEKLNELNPFYPAALTCQKLQQRAEACAVPVELLVLSGDPRPRFSNTPDLAHLERNLHRYPLAPYRGEVQNLRLLAAPNRRCEVESLAREITARVRDEGFRWHDMAVIVNNLDDYRDIFSTVFGDYDIPFFLDQKRPVSHHPLLEFIRSALEVVNYNWRSDAVFRCLKTEFLFPCLKEENALRKWRERVDKLENYVLAFGIQGSSAWLQEEPWEYRETDTLEDEHRQEKPSAAEEAFLKLINETRWKISAPLDRFAKKFSSAVAVKGQTSALYELLADAGVWERLKSWSEEALDRGEPEKAREHLQVYKGVIELMDQLVELMGEEKISASLYARIVESGLESMRLGLVPPSLDQVFIGNVERSRPGHVALTFLLGVNDGVLPSRPREDGIFCDEERDIISAWGVEPPPGSRRRFLDEQFLIYMALTRASRGLWVSYSLADEEGKAMLPSMLITHLKELFPGLREEFPAAEPGERGAGEKFAAYGPVSSGEEDSAVGSLLHYVANPRPTLAHLAVQLSRWKKGMEMHPLWWDVYNWYAADPSRRLQGKRLLGGLFYENREEPLQAETGLQLYGQRFKAGVSRIEKFRACPFAHFISHGLRLKERRIYRLESPDIGRFFHAALRNFAVTLQQKGMQWGELTREDCLLLSAEEVESLLPRLQKEILLSSRRYRYLAGKLKDTVGRAALMLAEHARRSTFKPVGLELPFGGGELLPAPVFELPNGCRMELVGRIDRVDLARDERGNAYLCVIDYKSGQAGLDLTKIFYGFSMQLLTYLDIVLTHAPSPQWLGEEALPAGVFYFRVHAPFVNTASVLPPEKAAQELRKCYRLRGRVLEDINAVRLMDNLLQEGYSEVIPVALTKKSGFYKGSATLNVRHFELLREHTRNLLKDTAARISAGQVEISPYRLGQEHACTYCPYKAVCQFDTSLEGNSYRLLQKLEEEHIWPALEQFYGQKGGDLNGTQRRDGSAKTPGLHLDG